MPDLTLIAALLGGLIIMAFAGDFLVNGAVAVARRMGVSPLIAGTGPATVSGHVGGWGKLASWRRVF